MLIVLNESTHDEYLSQSLQTNIEQFKEGVTFLTGNNERFYVTNSNKKLYFAKSNTDNDGFFNLLLHQGLTKPKD